MADPCEYNPKHKQPSMTPPSEGDCPNLATVCLGADGKWHVCSTCAALPEFNRYRKRTPVGGTKR